MDQRIKAYRLYDAARKVGIVGEPPVSPNFYINK